MPMSYYFYMSVYQNNWRVYLFLSLPIHSGLSAETTLPKSPIGQKTNFLHVCEHVCPQQLRLAQ